MILQPGPSGMKTPKLPTPQLPPPSGPIRLNAGFMNLSSESGSLASTKVVEGIRNAQNDQSNPSSLSVETDEKIDEIQNLSNDVEVSGFTVRDGLGADLRLRPRLITGKTIFQLFSIFCC